VRKLKWVVMPDNAQLLRLRAALNDSRSSYWACWHNSPGAAVRDEPTASKWDEAATEATAVRMPRTKSLQESLGRILFGVSPGEIADKPQAKPGQSSPTAYSPTASPRSVFRRIFSSEGLSQQAS